MEWRRESVSGFGRAIGGESEVLRPTSEDQVREAMAAPHGPMGLALRGAGCSYGDASTNPTGRALDSSEMRTILGFDPATGIARVEPGVTIRDLWRASISHGFWPAVVPGTQAVSVGGAAAMNIHGKNNYAVGPFGECVRRFRLATPNGEVLECSREENSKLFHAAIGGFGMLGCMTEIELELKRVSSGRMSVSAMPVRDLDEHLGMFDSLCDSSDYLVGWLDHHAKGAALGRGEVHRAVHFGPGEDSVGEALLDPAEQDVPPTLFGAVPKGWIWPGIWLATRCRMDGAVNYAKWRASFAEASNSPYPQTHGAFHFLLDYVPGWNRAFAPLIQFQPFIPAAEANRVMRDLFEMCHASRLVPYLGVLKRHRPDGFLMTHALDGFSIAMDFRVGGEARRAAVWELTGRMAEVVLNAGGRFYYAKDATLGASTFERIHGIGAVEQFRELKAQHDPNNVLQTGLSRRLFAKN